MVWSDSCDKSWKTCCALHNMLLEIDGLDKAWESGVPSDWEGKLGLFSGNDVQAHVPFAIRHAMANSLRTYDAASNYDETDALMDVRLELERDPNKNRTVAQATVNGIRIVRRLSFTLLQGASSQNILTLCGQGTKLNGPVDCRFTTFHGWQLWQLITSYLFIFMFLSITNYLCHLE